MEPKDRVETVVKTKVGAMQEKAGSGTDDAPGKRYTVAQAEVESIIENWPPAPKKIVPETIKKYGLPNEATPTLLIWHDSGPWKRTIITSDETAHDFPTPHTDYISQTVNYDVPLEKLADVLAFDGSIIVYRTAGQVTASCDNEAANLLTVNLLHDIVTGGKTVDEARHEFGEQTAAWLLNREAPYTESVVFAQPSEADTGYRDDPVMKESTLHQAVEKVKDVLGAGEGRD